MNSGYLKEASFVFQYSVYNMTPEIINQKLQQIEKFKNPKYRALSYSFWTKYSNVERLTEVRELINGKKSLPIFTVLHNLFIRCIDSTFDYQNEVRRFFKNEYSRLFNKSSFPKDLIKIIEEYVVVDLKEIPTDENERRYNWLDFGGTYVENREIINSISESYISSKVNLTDNWESILVDTDVDSPKEEKDDKCESIKIQIAADVESPEEEKESELSPLIPDKKRN